MAPLSILPGRVRFEAKSLTGCQDGCLLLEDALSSVNGVTEASASHRTGRVLVLFDEKLVSRGEIEAQLGQALRGVAERKERGDRLEHSRPGAASRGSSSGVGHFVMEMALHAFLPAPLDLLLPMAATGLRR